MLDEKDASDLATIIESVDAVKSANFKIVFDPTLVRECLTIRAPSLRSALTGSAALWAAAAAMMRWWVSLRATRRVPADFPSDLSAL